MALITKILEATLTAGSTSVVFTDSAIPNSLLRVFSSNSDLIPTSRTLSGNSLTVTYTAQTNNIDVALEITKAGIEIVDNVTSTDTDKALSAKQGKVLKDAIDTTDGNLSDLANVVDNLDIPDNITDLNDVNVTSIQDGQVLAWDEDANKFVNIDQSSGSIIFSSSEIVVGKWIDDKNLYQMTYTYETVLPVNQNTFTTLISNTGLNVDTLVFGFAKPTKESVFTPIALQMSGDNLQGYFSSTWSIKNLTIYYTKTS